MSSRHEFDADLTERRSFFTFERNGLSNNVWNFSRFKKM